ncbi:HEAT repeat domain-containing protein [Kitasatospora cineracea]|uniref:HEAT repeat domain-containing protein n=1 Tax=Kitasatospora cineracea TaxID=88074 RepID=UPI0034388140
MNVLLRVEELVRPAAVDGAAGALAGVDQRGKRDHGLETVVQGEAQFGEEGQVAAQAGQDDGLVRIFSAGAVLSDQRQRVVGGRFDGGGAEASERGGVAVLDGSLGGEDEGPAAGELVRGAAATVGISDGAPSSLRILCLLERATSGGALTDSPLDLADRLVGAVTAGDIDMVRTCLEQGAVADTPGPDGLPLLCTAVARFDHLVAEALIDGGADQDRGLPDGGTPLLRAVDTGSPTLVSMMLGNDPRLRLPEASQRQLLDLARHWHETGAVEELRRRTGVTDPAVKRQVDVPHQGDVIDEFSLGGLTVRDGHGAILTHLEWAFGLFTPLDEVIARALPHAEEGDSNWFAAAYYLGLRRKLLHGSDLAALRRHPDPTHRRFLAQVVWHRSFHAGLGHSPHTAHDLDFLASWVREESDGQVIAAILDAYAGRDHPEQEAIGLRYINHSDPAVRSEAVFCLDRERATPALLDLAHDPAPEVRGALAQALPSWSAPDKRLEPAVRDALLLLIRDENLGVRYHAARSLSGYDDRSAPVLDAFLSLLDEDEAKLRLEAAWALALRGHPRTEEAYERVGPLEGFSEHDHRTSGLWRYRVDHRNGPV